MSVKDQRPTWGNWLLALGLALVGGFLAIVVMLLIATFSMGALAILAAIVVASTCLAAGWLLRSWWGLTATAVVYVAVAAVMWYLVGGGSIFSVEFALYFVLPAVVMSAIGTVVGMYQAGQRGKHPQYGQPAS
jgi:uncharacterized BrkB/YihY/UPF0761 family membrane protein